MSNAVAPATSARSKAGESSNTSEQSTFLFVNESSGAPRYKSGNRSDVRAHVRKVSAKQFGLTHKVPRKRAERLPRYAPLMTQGLDSVTIKGSEHHRNCPTSVPKILQASPSSSSSLPAARTLIEFTESPSKTIQSREFIKSSESVEPQGLGTAHCHACGLPLDKPGHKPINQKEQSSLIPTKRIPAKSNPVGIFGAGRIDPFSSLPMDETSNYAQELLDHAVTYTLPGLWPDDAPPGEVNPLSKAWFTSSLRMPLLFHALIYSGSNHLDYMRHSAIYPNAPKPLSHKLIVIQKLNAALSDPNLALRDEVILAILILASQEVFIGKKGKRNPFNSPLQSLGWLNVYGNFKFVPQHTKAVADIIIMRGGLETLELHGLAEIIVSGDVISATNALTKPGWPQLRRLVNLITSIRVWAISPPWPLIQTQASAFWSLRSYGITDSMLEVFDSIGALTHAIGVHLQGKPFGRYLGTVHRTRTAIQHSLLLLPTFDELNLRPKEEGVEKKNVYECCRLTALIYGVAVVYPVPNSHGVLQKLVTLLQVALVVLNIESCGSDLDGVLLWMVALGGIAALDKPERVWFASQLGGLMRKQGIGDWGDAEDILESFLWLESACGQGGHMLWDEAMGRFLW